MKMIKKLSLRDQIIILLFIQSILILLTYILLSLAIKDTHFYQNHNILFNIIFFVSAFTLLSLITSFVVDILVSPIQKIIGYLKDFNNTDFSVIRKKLYNSDLISINDNLQKLQAVLLNDIDELKKKNQEVENLVLKNQLEYEYKKNLITSLTHDLKTPLAVIHVSLSALRDGIFSEEQKEEEISKMILEIEKTSSMIQDMISIYKFDNEIKNANVTDINLLDLINNVTANLQKLFVKYHQTLNINAEKSYSVKADNNQLERLLTNLVLNAITHSPENNSVTINLEDNNIEIINTGVNIDEDELENIFKPFYKVDESRTRLEDSGNGLGLYIANEIAKNNNAKIEVKNLDNAVSFKVIFNK